MNKTSDNNIETFAKELCQYVELRTTHAKLSATEHLSTAMSSAIGLIIFLILAGIALLFLAIAILFWLGSVIGYGDAAILISLIFVVTAVVVYLKRKSLVASSMIPIFLRLFFDDREKPKSDEQ